MIRLAPRFPESTGDALLVPATVIISAFSVLMVVWLMFATLNAPQLRLREIPIELTAVAEGASFVRLSPREVIVMVDASGGIRTAGSALSLDALTELLGRLSAQSGGTSVTVRADTRAPYGTIARVLAATRRAGIRDASLLLVEAGGSGSIR